MRTLLAWLLRFVGLFGRNRIDQEISEEIEIHLQMQIEDNLHSGMGPDQARRSALIKLGNGESARQAYRERSTLPLLENLAQDLRFTLRQLYRRPGFTTTAVLVLALRLR
jgi:macrolide transport system ATP-binding/permease protein